METSPSQNTATQTTSIAKLQELLQAEMSAVETYELALKSVSHVGLHRTLQEILVSHARRVTQLREKVIGLGGELPTSSGVWGVFAKVFQAGADMLGDRTAISALEQGEDHALSLYGGDMASVDAKTRKLIDIDLGPEQKRTHDICRTLQTYMRHPS